MTSISPVATSDADQLIALLDEQRGMYERLHELSAGQAALVRQGKTDELLGLLSERQSLIDTIGQLNTQIAPLRERWSAAAETIPADKRARLRGLLDDVEGLLKQIITQDEHDRSALQSQKTQVASQLKQTSAAPKALNAYRSGGVPSGPRPATNPRFTDSRG